MDSQSWGCGNVIKEDIVMFEQNFKNVSEIFNIPGYRVENWRHSWQWDPNAQRYRTWVGKTFVFEDCDVLTVRLQYTVGPAPNSLAYQSWWKRLPLGQWVARGSMMWSMTGSVVSMTLSLHYTLEPPHCAGIGKSQVTKVISLLIWGGVKIKPIKPYNVLYNYIITV